ncbi:hypothetical protein J2853_008921 [Streptosporangium lutulentum]|uniref:Uncharacterized protein n=1 Tax=Streptosporangium lutulentum TaxID=1461250 RepID=A0ABT9QTH1_9ACTN|nr:hypothetical protein [Streptosporangium lutulentum]
MSRSNALVDASWVEYGSPAGARLVTPPPVPCGGADR